MYAGVATGSPNAPPRSDATIRVVRDAWSSIEMVSLAPPETTHASVEPETASPPGVWPFRSATLRTLEMRRVPVSTRSTDILGSGARPVNRAVRTTYRSDPETAGNAAPVAYRVGRQCGMSQP